MYAKARLCGACVCVVVVAVAVACAQIMISFVQTCFLSPVDNPSDNVTEAVPPHPPHHLFSLVSDLNPSPRGGGKYVAL